MASLGNQTLVSFHVPVDSLIRQNNHPMRKY